MKFVFSYIDLGGGKKPNISLVKVSNFLIQNQGFETIFFGDKSSLNFLETVSFSQRFEIKEEETKNIPKCIWSFSKFIAMSKMTEPFVHVDFDVFLFKIEKNLLNKNLLCMYSEQTPYLKSLIEFLQKSIKIYPKEITIFEQISYNCGIVGGVNFHFLKEISLYLLKYLSDNKSFIDKMYSDLLNENDTEIRFIPVLIEQVWMFQLFKFYKEEFFTYIPSDLGDQNFQIECVEKGFLHFQSAEHLKAVKETVEDFVKNFKIS